jgi:two-component system, chemotaxis family, protein-glutamate methylesterase/glutaminase
VEDKIRTVIVDDSAFVRFTLTQLLSRDRGIELVGTAVNGEEAVARVKELRPDVVTMDVEMPKLDGLSALERIMKECPTPVIMLSSLTGRGTEATLRALELGAIDFFMKPSATSPSGDAAGTVNLLDIIRAAAKVKLNRNGNTPAPGSDVTGAAIRPGKAVAGQGIPEKAVVIGSSTGGPRALYQLVPELPAFLPATVLIVQHMPAGFTKPLADRLDSKSLIVVKEAESGDRLEKGKAYLAPGGYHMVINKDMVVRLVKSPPVCNVRPSVNVTMESVARVFGAGTTGVVLTGMGNDGTDGSAIIREVGGRVVAEDESTSLIYGMPKAVVDAGYADRTLPLPRIAGAIVEMLNARLEVCQR